MRSLSSQIIYDAEGLHRYELEKSSEKSHAVLQENIKGKCIPGSRDQVHEHRLENKQGLENVLRKTRL